jgi:hypothetical protein
VRPTTTTTSARRHNGPTGTNNPTADTRDPDGSPVVVERFSGAQPEVGSGDGQNGQHLYTVKVPSIIQSCPDCHLPTTPTDGQPPCSCGQYWGVLSPVKPSGEAWEGFLHMLLTRSGGLCEARTPWCLAGRSGSLASLSRDRVSIHHRQPRGRGGTRRYDRWVPEAGRMVEQLPTFAEAVAICGTGTTGCHGFIEDNRALMYMLGWLVPMPVPGRPVTAATDPASVVLVLPTRRRVLLDPHAPFYVPAPDGWRWAA